MDDSIAGQRHDRTALVLYGTETGNSQDVAEELAHVLERLHFTTSVCQMDDVEIVGLPQNKYTILLAGKRRILILHRRTFS